MIYRRTLWNKPVLDAIVQPVVKRRQPTIHDDYSFANSLALATNGVTIFASHYNSDDVPLLDYTVSTLTNDKHYPVFLMRHNLQMIRKLPAFASRFLARTILREAIFIDQTDSQSLPKIAPEIDAVYNQGQPIVIFPGATRTKEYINKLIPESVARYALLLKRTLKKENPYFTTATICYDNDETHITLGETKAFGDFKARELGDYVLETLAKQLGVSTNGLESKESVLQKIRSR